MTMVMNFYLVSASEVICSDTFVAKKEARKKERERFTTTETYSYLQQKQYGRSESEGENQWQNN